MAVPIAGSESTMEVCLDFSCVPTEGSVGQRRGVLSTLEWLLNLAQRTSEDCERATMR